MPTSPPERWPCPIGRRNDEPAAQEWAGSHAFLDRVTTFLQFNFDPIRCLCEFLLGFALEFTGFARNLHLLVTEQFADSALDFAAKLFRTTFYTFAHIRHDNLLGMRTAIESCFNGTDLAIVVPSVSSRLSTFSHK